MILPKRSLVKHFIVLMFSRFDAPANTQLGMCIFLTFFKGGCGGGQTHVKKYRFRKGLSIYYVIQDGGGGSSRFISILQRGGSPQYITILHWGVLKSLFQYYSFERKMECFNPF